MVVKGEVKLSTISYLIIYCRDPEKTLPFYRDVLGLTVKNHEPGWIELDTGAMTLCLHKDEKLPEKRAANAVVVFEVEDIEGTYEALKQQGIEFVKGPHVVCEAPARVGKSADFGDPDGNMLSIFGWCKS